jgi:hypothetical protein
MEYTTEAPSRRSNIQEIGHDPPRYTPVPPGDLRLGEVARAYTTCVRPVPSTVSTTTRAEPHPRPHGSGASESRDIRGNVGGGRIYLESEAAGWSGLREPRRKPVAQHCRDEHRAHTPDHEQNGIKEPPPRRPTQRPRAIASDIPGLRNTQPSLPASSTRVSNRDDESMSHSVPPACRLGGELDVHGQAVIIVASRPDSTSVRLDDRAADGKTMPRPWALVVTNGSVRTSADSGTPAPSRAP